MWLNFSLHRGWSSTGLWCKSLLTSWMVGARFMKMNGMHKTHVCWYMGKMLSSSALQPLTFLMSGSAGAWWQLATVPQTGWLSSHLANRLEASPWGCHNFTAALTVCWNSTDFFWVLSSGMRDTLWLGGSHETSFYPRVTFHLVQCKVHPGRITQPALTPATSFIWGATLNKVIDIIVQLVDLCHCILKFPIK